MKKKITLALLLVLMLACVFALTVGATEVDPNAEYYDKVYTDANGKEFPIYEKVGDTYYPLVWFAYEEGEGEATVTKYVKVHFEDINCYSLEPSQGRFNGCYYTHTDENGNTIELNTKNLVVLNLRAGVMATTYSGSKKQNGTNRTILTIETNRTDVFPSWSRIEAVYIPHTQKTVGSLNWSSLRVCDIDVNHPIAITFGSKAFQNSKIEEIFIPAGSKFESNSNFQGCAYLKKVVFAEGFTASFPNYLFDRCSSLEMVCFMGSESEMDAITVGTSNNGYYNNLVKISAAEYEALADKSGKYKIYNCTECIAFNGGKHTMSDEKVILGDNYFAQMKVACPCSVDGCVATMDVDTIPALFTWKGYSVSTFADKNGNYSMAQWFGVNNAAISKYVEYYGDFDFGVVAAIGIDKPISVVDGVVVTDENAVSAPISTNVDGGIEFKNDYFEIKITGIPGAGSEKGDQRDTAIAFNGYVVAGGAVKYIHFGETYDKAQGASYNSLINE